MKRLLKLMTAILVVAPASYGAIARDTGASTFPVTGSRVDTNVATVVSTAFSTSQAVTLIVGVGYRNNTPSIFPMTVTWHTSTPSGASSWTKVREDHTPGGEVDAAIFIATASSVLSSVQIDITATATEASNSVAYEIDAITGASTTITNTGGVTSNGTTVNRFVSLTGVVSGSWLYVASSADDSGAVYTTQTNTVKAVETRAGVNGHQSAAGYNSSGTSGSVNVGWTGTQAWIVLTAIEVPSGGPPPSVPYLFQQGGTRLRLRNTGRAQ
jgi:hypothetical protein